MDEVEPPYGDLGADAFVRAPLRRREPSQSSLPATTLLRSLGGRLVGVHVVAGAPRWLPASARRVGPRATLVTVTLALAAVALFAAGGWRMPFAPAVTIGGAPERVSAAWAAPAVAVQGYAPRPTGSGGWEQLSLPLQDGATLVSEVTSPADPQTLYACTGRSGELRVWRTQDAGAHWVSLALPRMVGRGCALRVAPDTASRLAVLVTPNASDVDSPGCSDDTLYLSDDAGASWMRLTHPSLAPIHTQCALTYWPTARHLFVETDYTREDVVTRVALPGGGTEAHVSSATIVERSDDEGRTWERADTGISGAILNYGVSQGASGETLMAMADSDLYRDTPFWRSGDAGRTWQHLNLSFAQGALYIHPDWTSVQHEFRPPVYGYTDSDAHWRQFELQIAQLGADGRTWKALPPLAVPGTDPTHTGLFQPLGELSDGRLLALGAPPGKGIPPQDVLDKETVGIPPEWFALWLWDPRAAHWQLVASPAADLVTRACPQSCTLTATAGTKAGTTSGGKTTRPYLWLLENPSPAEKTPSPAALYRLALDAHPLS